MWRARFFLPILPSLPLKKKATERQAVSGKGSREGRGMGVEIASLASHHGEDGR